jgi:hypothetical protein
MMNNSNRLLAALDDAYGFPNKTSSTFRKLKQSYDNKKNQHVIWLAYIVTVNPGQQTESVKKPAKRRKTLLQSLLTEG